MSRAEQLQRLARRMRVEHVRLRQTAQILRASHLPLIASDIDTMSLKCATVALALSHVADRERDKEGNDDER